MTPGAHGRAILEVVSPTATLAQTLEPLRLAPERAAVLLDVDGTLAPIVDHAEDAHVPEATRSLLIEVTRRYCLVACVSGRRAQAARQIVAIGSIAYVGNHGAELLAPGATQVQALDPALAAMGERVADFAQRSYAGQLRTLRVRLEDKGVIAAFHWRGAPDEDAAAAAVREVAERAESEGLAVHWGRKVLEVRPPLELGKGRAIAELLREGCGAPQDEFTAFAAALYVGDDRTDVDAFRALRSLAQEGNIGAAVCAAVASEEAPDELIGEADVILDGPAEVRALLAALLEH
jgi:trehalose 6-phosphate phosphatase